MSWIKEQFYAIVNISDHIDIESTTENIKKSIVFRGINVWILAFAVIVASVGLNVNSIPVIIGAMLISPLMGPIMGTGLAVGINDTQLLKRSLKNFAVMVVISIAASTTYFLISPLALAEPTELLARTRPTIYDVFIAFFGGMAGIIESARKDKGTVFAGVAIATALMPPLCTAGYGIANGNFSYFSGAMYLFIINSLFIALSTFIIIRYLKFPFVHFADPAKERRVRRSISLFAMVIIIPSIYSGFVVIRENNFNQSVKRFLSENKSLEIGYIYDHKIDHSKKSSTLELSIAGERLSDTKKEIIFQNLEKYGISRGQVFFNENTVYDNKSNDEAVLKSIFERSDKEVAQREDIIKNLSSRLDSIKSLEIPYEQITKEIMAQHPGVLSLSLARGSEISISPYAAKNQIVAVIKWSKPLNDNELKKLQEWLSVRLNTPNIRIVQSR
ncbi:MAG: TIGR00341 family protein [Bacteroidetes bacterium HGW-Bacteroidetes-5]|jgi:uncharacterized hydrophobic protein (TIGR00271 family)|nr:MAG: TIGR00341 family protein [Bacteroidetes bacterium HGW-Bacteroidetes-5]